ncbi:RNA polymerase sigma-70 factor (ECF subfamily) [Arcticibacter tournemirensis]|uniref:Sigma-70 family RNA polymerase sigma factor n=1 Tax=Arcticibacter tournemirensis TaxID=699437 RepID=A0A5M9HFC3_9SPHI|nr:sigma-70 family RNA polymerase sigma factor [Arcticibacter tournemirensis]KAA8485500.1 sigma-70 family RNA polymerase sigma factor [Arcticibacter tournemirensis]TQM48794.1 RNA polymerase sigma-70 factor (ECF subfamily) [Arcticibacter tournemirensis]
MRFIKNKLHSAEADEAAILSDYRRTGDLELLGRLYQGYMPLVYGLCLKYFKDEELSKDAVMQIFEQLIDKLRRHEVSNFKSWLYTLARNYCLMALRSSSKHIFVPVEDGVMERDGIVHLNIDESKENALSSMEKCMEKLPDDQRISIDLFYLQEKCYKEVADITGFDMNKVKSYIQNGKRNLKICMEKNSGNE